MLDAGRDAPGLGQFELAAKPAVDRIGDKTHCNVVAANDVEGALALPGVSRSALGVNKLRAERVAWGGRQVQDRAERGRISELVIGMPESFKPTRSAAVVPVE